MFYSILKRNIYFIYEKEFIYVCMYVYMRFFTSPLTLTTLVFFIVYTDESLSLGQFIIQQQVSSDGSSQFKRKLLPICMEEELQQKRNRKYWGKINVSLHVCIRVCACVCVMYMCTSMCNHTCVCKCGPHLPQHRCGGQKKQDLFPPRQLLLCLLELPWVTNAHHYAQPYTHSGDLHALPYVYMANALPLEPSPCLVCCYLLALFVDFMDLCRTYGLQSPNDGDASGQGIIR